jgi:hypothetical protein
VDVYSTTYFDLSLICRGIRSAGYRQSHRRRKKGRQDLAPVGLIGLVPHIFPLLSAIEMGLERYKNRKVFREVVGESSLDKNSLILN